MKRLAWLLLAVILGLTGVSRALSAPSLSASSDPIAHPTFRLPPGPPSYRSTSLTPVGYTPAQIRHAYGFDALGADGTGQIIGVVDAYDAPTIGRDLQTFISTYGLPTMNGLPGAPACSVARGPHPCFQKTYSGNPPPTDAAWAVEISLDVQWAHVVAPGADILLVETPSCGISDLLGGVDAAVNRGARSVSMSWGTSEYATETFDDRHFNRPGVSFTAAAGDSGPGVLWPSSSPFVVSVAGTSLSLDSAGNVLSETAWSGSGGGISAFEAEPGYQTAYGISGTGDKRGNPDVAYAADPARGVAIFDSTPYAGMSGWIRIGGTSMGAPQWAGLFALANQLRDTDSTMTSLGTPLPVYTAGLHSHATSFRDIAGGGNGSCSWCTATAGYDLVTGLGVPRVDNLAPTLARSSSPFKSRVYLPIVTGPSRNP